MIRFSLIAAMIFIGSFCRSSGDEASTQVFDATIHSIKSIYNYRGTAIKTDPVPYFVVTLELDEDVAGLGKKGERVDVAIHSPARDFLMGDYKSAKYPHRYRFSLSKLQSSGSLTLRGIGTNAQQPGSGQPATRPADKTPAEVTPPTQPSKDAPR